MSEYHTKIDPFRATLIFQRILNLKIKQRTKKKKEIALGPQILFLQVYRLAYMYHLQINEKKSKCFYQAIVSAQWYYLSSNLLVYYSFDKLNVQVRETDTDLSPIHSFYMPICIDRECNKIISYSSLLICLYYTIH